MKDHYVKIQFSLIINYLIYRLYEESFKMSLLSFQAFKKVLKQLFIEVLIKIFVKNSFQFKASKRNEKKHLLSYYIAFK